VSEFVSFQQLYEYFVSNKCDVKFHANNENSNIGVSVPGNLTFDSQDKTDETEGLLPVTLQACHILKNNNQSFISEDSMNNALPSFSNRPILGYIHEVDGVPQFYTHNMHISEDEELVYDEIPVGVIPESCNARLEYDSDKKQTYCCVEGYIYEEYSKAAEIIQREGQCPVSVELSVREMSYNAKDKILNLEDFYFSGVTVLGYDESGKAIKPGMAGSNIKINNAANEDISFEQNDKLIETLEALNKTLEELKINNANGKEEKPMDKFNELLEKYGKTAEDITFSYEGLSDKELETAFAEAFAEQEDNSGSEGLGTQQFDGDSETDPETDPEADPETDNTLDNDAGSEEDEDGNGVDGEDDSDDGAANNNDESDPKRQNNELSKGELFDQLFELSFDEIRQGLNALCSIYRNDEEWCYVEDVYEDYFIMYDWDSNKVWKQSYTKDGDNLSLNGERTQLFIMLLTESEKISIENMRQNYESVCGQLAQYQKQELVASADYAAIADKEDFSKLAAEVNDGKNEMTFEELKNTVDQMLLNYAKSGNLTFAKPENRAPARMSLSPSGVKGTPKKSRYGNLFSKKR